ncbi:hypothetical protein ABFS83_08G145500 [Erythranthe nasuta]
MAEDFQGGVCGGGNWWPAANPSRIHLFGSSPCSSEFISDAAGIFGSWPINNYHDHHSLITDMQTTPANSFTSADDSPAGSASDDGAAVSIVLPAKPHHNGNLFSKDWNQDFLKSEQDYSNMMNTNFCDDSAINNSCNINIQTLNNNYLNNLPLNSASYSYTSSLLQNLFDIDSPQPQQYLLHNNNMQEHNLNNNNYSSSPNNYPMINNSSEISPKENHLQFTNNTPFWNAMAEASNNVRPATSFIPLNQVITSKKPNPNNFNTKHHNKEGRKLDSVAKNESATKRPRIETPSPLPTFKVRKEKMGDRITALQQLVSPFGKTDTASVLHEAIDYIKFLHDQVLSSPYLNSKPPPPHRHQAANKTRDEEKLTQLDLKSRGLCLVPISSTFPIASETTSDFWTPTFGGSFR